MTMHVPKVDWSTFVGEKPTVHCQCGAVYKTLAKGVVLGTLADGRNRRFTIITQDPCPKCGKTIDHAMRVEHDPERQTIVVGNKLAGQD